MGLSSGKASFRRRTPVATSRTSDEAFLIEEHKYEKQRNSGEAPLAGVPVESTADCFLSKSLIARIKGYSKNLEQPFIRWFCYATVFVALLPLSDFAVAKKYTAATKATPTIAISVMFCTDMLKLPTIAMTKEAMNGVIALIQNTCL